MAYVLLSNSVTFSAIDSGYTFICRGISAEGSADVYYPNRAQWKVLINGIYIDAFKEFYAPLDGEFNSTFFIVPELSTVTLEISYYVYDAYSFPTNRILTRMYGNMILTDGRPSNMIVGDKMKKQTEHVAIDVPKNAKLPWVPGMPGKPSHTKKVSVSKKVPKSSVQAPAQQPPTSRFTPVRRKFHYKP